MPLASVVDRKGEVGFPTPPPLATGRADPTVVAAVVQVRGGIASDAADYVVHRIVRGGDECLTIECERGGYGADDDNFPQLH